VRSTSDLDVFLPLRVAWGELGPYADLDTVSYAPEARELDLYDEEDLRITLTDIKVVE
jgi:hypothetical protein